MSHLISPTELEDTITRLFVQAGTTTERAQQVAANLVLANLSGHDSHGVGMAPRYVDAILEGRLDTRADVAVRVDNGMLLGLDGQSGFGQVVGVQAMEMAFARVAQHGACIFSLASAHHCAQQFASHGGGIGGHAHFLHAHVTRTATVRVAGAAFARNRLVTLPEMLHKPSMPTHRAARHALHCFKLNAALRHGRIKRFVGLGVRALIVQSRARLVGAALGDGIPLHHVSV